MEAGPEGVVTSWTWVDTPNPNHPLDRPFVFVLIQLDGADTAMVHVVDGPREGISTGVRVRGRWRDERTGYVTDVECFEVVEGGRMSPDAKNRGAADHAVPGGAALRSRRRRRRSPATPRRCSTAGSSAAVHG